jgi:hypothetical protein
MVFSALARLGGPVVIGRRKFARKVVVAAYSEMLVRVDRTAAQS